MTHDSLVAEIYDCLNNDNPDLVGAASKLGVDALHPLQRIISTDNLLAPKALLLEKIIRLFWDLPPNAKPEKRKKDRFAAGMKSIATTSPDGHIKGFASDMLRGKR